jgi:uncharacterized protein involved in type VI secretion and phage assembly
VSAGAHVDGGALRHFGVYPAIVTDIVDPDALGRLEVKLPWLGADGDAGVRLWATLCTPYAGDGQGFEMLPAVETQVVIAFEAGDLRRPYIIGSCWNGREGMPAVPAAANDMRVLRTRSGSVLEFDDAAGGPKATLSTASGHRLVLDEGAGQVRVAHASGAEITIDATGAVNITALSTIDLTAPALDVHAPVAAFDGIVECTTLVCSVGVVSPTYTPGLGNLV